MCVICGCGDDSNVRIEGQHAVHEHVLVDGTRVQHSHDDHEHTGHHHHGGEHDHDHDHDHEHNDVHDHDHVHAHGHDHGHGHGHSRAAHRKEAPAELIALETSLLQKNQRIAERNRGWFAGRGVFALNIMSSPGSGKTTLLVRTLTDLSGEVAMTVVEGDQETSADADRIRATGARAIQVNTGAGCHLEADMLEQAVQQLGPPQGSVLFIENVGNLVCPALFDLGEKARVVVLSVTEGDDKPLKYPHMFRTAQLMVTTKMDLAPYVDFDVERAEAHARSINPSIQCLRVSSTTGEGLTGWYGWLRASVAQERVQ
jgi:hydrogenase nickel incorporation protein HypB